MIGNTQITNNYGQFIFVGCNQVRCYFEQLSSTSKFSPIPLYYCRPLIVPLLWLEYKVGSIAQK